MYPGVGGVDPHQYIYIFLSWSLVGRRYDKCTMFLYAERKGQKESVLIIKMSKVYDIVVEKNACIRIFI